VDVNRQAVIRSKLQEVKLRQNYQVVP